MIHKQCHTCGREIVIAKRSDTHEPMALEKIYPYTIDISMIGSTAQPVEPLDKSEKLDLYIAHSRVCSKKDAK